MPLTHRWEDIRDDLFEIVYKLTGPLAKEDQEVVEREMQARGFDIKWNAIRKFCDFSQTNTITTTPTPQSDPNQSTTEMSKPGRVLMTWDQTVHEDLLVCLVTHLKPEGKDYVAVTEMMHAKGYTFSEGALTYVPSSPAL
ncbi:hypothetical protein QBC43DRAFT_288253 [Cladorrhinum sp. PSN259]|nr:hypothetical protein QBC43DRAFT_288253 [Cladorrhinum sp. PSN259]